MKITTNNISTLPAKSAAAVVTIVPVNALCVGGQPQDFGLLDREQASAFIADCKRVSQGPIAVLLLHGADDWSEVMKQQGLYVQRRTYMADTFDLVVASAGPIDLPDDNAVTVAALIEAITRLVSAPGTTVVVPFALTRLAPMAVRAAGRQVIALTPSTSHVEELEAYLEGRRLTAPLTDPVYATAVDRMKAGEGVCRIAQSLGVCVSRLNGRLIKDGHRAVQIRRPRKDREAAAGEQACVEGTQELAGV